MRVPQICGTRAFAILRPVLAVVAVLPFGASVMPAGGADPAEWLTVATSGGTAAALRALAAEYGRSHPERVRLVFGPSMGDTAQAIPARIGRGEDIDAVIMVGSAVDGLADGGGVLPGSVVPIACSHIAMAVRAGAPRPDIATVGALREALLRARSVAYSDSASGVFLSTRLFPRLGLSEALRGKAHMVRATPVGEVVARGGAELGFQELSELLPLKGVDVVGLLPAAAQLDTTYSGAVVAGSRREAAAEMFLAFLQENRSREELTRTGLVPGQCSEADKDQDRETD